MEKHPILRSLVAEGRPPGTGRPASFSPRGEPRSERFDERLESARRSKDETAERASGASRGDSEPLERTRESEAPETLATDEVPTSAQPAPQTESPAQVEGSAVPAEAATPEANASDVSTGAQSSRAKPQATSPDASDSALPAPLLEAPAKADAAGAIAGNALAQNFGAAAHPAKSPAPNPTNPALNQSDSGSTALPATGPSLAEAALATAESPELPSEPAGTPSEAVATRAHASQDASNVLPPLREHEARPIERPHAAEAPAAPKEPPVSSDRAADVLRQIRLQLTPEMRQATIQLEPRELGRISIRIAMRGDAVHAELRVERKSTLEALERQVPELRAALDRSGLGGGELALELGLGRRGEHSNSGDSRSRATPSAREAAPAAPEALTAALARRLGPSAIDTYA